MSTPVYHDPILSADDINIEAYRESMARFAYAASIGDYAMADAALDHRYDVITDDQIRATQNMSHMSHPVDYNPSGKWPFKNPHDS